MTYVEIVKKNIAQMNVDCIVVPTNSTLTPDGGAAEAVFRAAGYAEMKKACEAFGRCDAGDFVVTPGFQLRANYAFHTVGPYWKGGIHHEQYILQRCYRKTLGEAKTRGCRSIAFPLISAGVNGYPLEEAWKIAIRTVLSEESDLCVYFAVLDEYTYGIGQQTLLLSTIDAEIFEAIDRTVLRKNIANVCHCIVRHAGNMKEDAKWDRCIYPTTEFRLEDIMETLSRNPKYKEALQTIGYLNMLNTDMSAAQVLCWLHYYEREERSCPEDSSSRILNGDTLKLLLRLDDLLMQYYEGTAKAYWNSALDR